MQYYLLLLASNNKSINKPITQVPIGIIIIFSYPAGVDIYEDGRNT